MIDEQGHLLTPEAVAARAMARERAAYLADVTAQKRRERERLDSGPHQPVPVVRSQPKRARPRRRR